MNISNIDILNMYMKHKRRFSLDETEDKIIFSHPTIV